MKRVFSSLSDIQIDHALYWSDAMLELWRAYGGHGVPGNEHVSSIPLSKGYEIESFKYRFPLAILEFSERTQKRIVREGVPRLRRLLDELLPDDLFRYVEEYKISVQGEEEEYFHDRFKLQSGPFVKSARMWHKFYEDRNKDRPIKQCVADPIPKTPKGFGVGYVLECELDQDYILERLGGEEVLVSSCWTFKQIYRIACLQRMSNANGFLSLKKWNFFPYIDAKGEIRFAALGWQGSRHDKWKEKDRWLLFPEYYKETNWSLSKGSRLFLFQPKIEI